MSAELTGPDLVAAFELLANHNFVQQRKGPGVDLDEAVLNHTKDSVGLASCGRYS